MTLLEWAIKYRVTPEALRELGQTCLFMQGSAPSNIKTEADLQRELRLEGARLGKYLFRNNRGAGKTEAGTYVRYGLANDSKALGDAVKSADLIGFERVQITIDMVGTHIARFLSVEAKSPEWKYAGTPMELAQVKWATLVNHEGGRAIITNKLGCL